MATTPQPTAANLTPVGGQLIEASSRPDPQNQRILWNALRDPGGGVPGSCVVLAMNR